MSSGHYCDDCAQAYYNCKCSEKAVSMKQTIKEEVKDSNWIDRLEDCTVAQAIEILKEFDDDQILEADYYGYDGGKFGVIYTERLETDAEEKARLDKAAKEQAERDYQLEWTRLRREREAQDLLSSQKIEDLALAEYLKRHKDNPNIDDMNNLFRVLIRAERDGHPKNGAAQSELRAVLERLERGE